MTIPAYVTNRDVNAAQAAVDTLDDALRDLGHHGLSVREQQAVRGVLAAFAADCREAGHAEGVQTGRLQVAHDLRTFLEDQGLQL